MDSECSDSGTVVLSGSGGGPFILNPLLGREAIAPLLQAAEQLQMDII